jgi:hypothetical protein
MIIHGGLLTSCFRLHGLRQFLLPNQLPVFFEQKPFELRRIKRGFSRHETFAVKPAQFFCQLPRG